MKVRVPLLARIIGWFFLNLLVLGVAGWLLLRERFGFSMLASRTAGERVAEVVRGLTAELDRTPRTGWNDVLARESQRHRVEFMLYLNDGGWIAGSRLPLPPEVHSRVIGAQAPASDPSRPPPDGQRRPNGPRPPAGQRLEGDPPPNGRGALNGEAVGGEPPRARAGNFGPPADEDDFDPPPPRDRPLGGPPPDRRGPAGRQRLLGPDGRPMNLAPDRELPDKILIKSNRPDRYWVLVRAAVQLDAVATPVALITVSDSPVGHGLYFDATPLLWAGAGVLLLSALVWFPLVRGITHSISQMRDAAGRLAEGRFDARVDARRGDELGELGSDINRMAERLAGYVEGQRRFLGDVAHELCAPVARLQMAVGILEQGASSAGEQERLTDVREEVEHMAGLVNELLQFTRASIGGKKVEVENVVLRPVAEKAVHREAGDPAQVRVEIDPALAVRSAPDLLLRALSNLVRNAIRYAGHAGPITVSAVRDGAEVFVSVTDQGPGVPAEALPKLFDPFFRVDGARTPGVPGGGGTGLGLAIVKTCVEASGGGVSARNVTPGGFEVTLRLPAASP